MIPYLHIGPLCLPFYGFWIAIGVGAFLLAAQRDKLAKIYLKHDELAQIVALGIILGIVGGRVLSIITDWPLYHSWYEMLAPWEPGFSLQGSMIAIAIGVPWYLYKKHVFIPAVLDIAGLYAPLLQAISRIGCFFAGCCSGAPSSVPWAVVYTHPESYATRNIPIHPSQLYSSLGLLIIFVLMHTVMRKFLHKPGQLFSAYLMLASIERFINDFWRAEHIPLWRSPEQWLAVCLFACGLVLLIGTSLAKNKKYS